MKRKISCKIRKHMEKTGIRMAELLEKTEKSVVLAAFEVISLCASFALQRFSQNSNSK